MSEQAKRSTGIFVINGTTIYQEVLSAAFPGVSVERIDTTSQNNAAGFVSRMCGWLTPGDVKFVVNFYGNTEQLATYTASLTARTNTKWTVGVPNFLAVSFVAFIADTTILTPMKGAAMTMEITLCVISAPQVLSTQATGLTTPWISMTNQTSTAITLTPTAAGSQVGTTYQGESLLADTGVKITPTAAAGSIYVNGVLTTSGAATSAITLGTNAGDVIYIPIVVLETNKYPAVYWVSVMHGYV